MAPPQLPRDAPVVNVLHPLQVHLFVLLGNDANGLVAVCVGLHGCDGLVGERLNLDEPLRREARLHNRLAAVAVAHVVGVVLYACQQSLRFEVFEDLLARSVAVETGVRTAVLVDVRGIVHHVDGGQVMPFAERKVIGIVCWRHLHRASAEVAADPLIEHDGDLAVHEREAQCFAVQVQETLVLGMDGHGHVAKHGLRPRGGDREILASLPAVVTVHRVANLPQVALVLVVDHFEVADGGLATRTPVDDVRAAIDEPLLVEAHEGFAHGYREVVVHGEVFAVPIDGGAQALHLAENVAAIVPAPFPHTLDECLAAHLLACGAFARDLALHQHLRRDAGVIGARHPENLVAAHTVPADEDVALSVLKHVAHVQVAGDIGRGQQNRERRLALRVFAFGGGGRSRLREEVFAHPVLGPVIFNGGRVVSFWQVVRHGGQWRAPRSLRRHPQRGI